VCNLGSLAIGDMETISIVVRTAVAGIIKNTATVSESGTSDPNSADNSATESGTVDNPPPQCLFTDDFEDGVVDSVNWTVVKPETGKQ
jgi:hypothetical protein